jgi:hypothetical protein
MAVSHFHLLVWGEWIDRYELSREWAAVVDAPEFAAHLAAGTKVEAIRSFRGVCSYAAKYISKASAVSLGDHAGRVWGTFNREALPVGESFTVKLTAAQTVRVVRHAKRLLFSRGVECEWMPRAIYLENPMEFVRLLDHEHTETEDSSDSRTWSPAYIKAAGKNRVKRRPAISRASA